MANGVRGQFGHEEDESFVCLGAIWDAPGVQPFRAQPATEAGTKWRGGEPHLEVVDRVGGLGGDGGAGGIVRHDSTVGRGGVA
ncbi:hypothetical protein [Streptomyces shaanxiensis]